VEHELPRWRGGINVLFETLQFNASLAHLVDCLDEVT